MNKQRSLFFGYHPGAAHLFFTSDDQCFLPNDERYADAHAQKLKDKKLDKVTREEFERWAASEEGKKELGAEGDGGPVKSAQQLLDEAQAAYDKAVAENAPEDVQADLKKKVSTAKAKVTREANKS